MSKIKSINSIIMELLPMIGDSVNYVNSCRKIVKDKSCKKCKHLYACDCDSVLKIK